jgi:hypothetical protein
MKLNLKSLLANQTTLYVVLAITIASVFGYIVNQRTNALLFFVLSGYLTSFFTKNMTIVMLVPLLLTNFVFSNFRFREGLEGKNGKVKAPVAGGNGGSANGNEDEEEEEEEDEGADAGAGAAKNNGKAAGAGAGAGAGATGAGEGAAAGNGKKGGKGNFKPNAEMDVKKTKDMKFSYFEKALDDGTIDKLNGDMDNMSEKHEKLEKMIENMAPLIDKAGGLLEKINGGGMGNLGGMVEKMSGMLGGITGQKQA